MGDVGDFGKYALLRALCGQFGIGPTFPLGIVWCLFPDESHNSDGRHTSYLDRDEYRILDPGLHDCLKEIVNDNNRSVAAIQAAGMLPKSTIFVDALASGVCEEGEGRVPARRERVSSPMVGSRPLNATDDCAIVFLDPDNGLSVASINKRHSEGWKVCLLGRVGEIHSTGPLDRGVPPFQPHEFGAYASGPHESRGFAVTSRLRAL